MTESRIERHLVDGVKKLGGMCIKFTSPGTQGVPDRIIITATGRIIFAELKRKQAALRKFKGTSSAKCRKGAQMCASSKGWTK